jgi:hypothetical protein
VNISVVENVNNIPFEVIILSEKDRKQPEIGDAEKFDYH